MPYVNGKRVSNLQWSELYSTARPLHTGPNGENPAEGPEVDPEVGAPPSKKKSKRSPRSARTARAAIADALGVKETSAVLDDIDVTGLDALSDTEEEA